MKLAATLAVGVDRPNLPYLFRGDPARACATMARLGFDAVELLLGEPGDLPGPRLDALLRRHGLSLAAIGTGGACIRHHWNLCSPAPSVRKAAEQYILDVLALAAPRGAVVILGLIIGAPSPGVSRRLALDRLVPVLNRLGRIARKSGTRLVVEPVNRYEGDFLNRLEDGLGLLARLDTDGIGLLADLFHMNIEEASLPEAIRRAGKAIGHVHLADSNRRVPGDGHLDFPAALKALRTSGYGGFFSIEALPRPSPRAAAAQAVAVWRQWARLVNDPRDMPEDGGLSLERRMQS